MQLARKGVYGDTKDLARGILMPGTEPKIGHWRYPKDGEGLWENPFNKKKKNKNKKSGKGDKKRGRSKSQKKKKRTKSPKSPGKRVGSSGDDSDDESPKK